MYIFIKLSKEVGREGVNVLKGRLLSFKYRFLYGGPIDVINGLE